MGRDTRVCDNARFEMTQGDVVRTRTFLLLAALAVSPILLSGCAEEPEPTTTFVPLEMAEPRPEVYADFTLTADLSDLSDNQRKMIGVLIEASQVMDDLFWRQAFGDDYEAWLDSIADIDTRRLTRILREKGAQAGCIMVGNGVEQAAIEKAGKFPGIAGRCGGRRAGPRPAPGSR